MLRDKVQALSDQFFEENTSLFLLDMKIGADNRISITIDGDQGVTLNDCVALSRHIEHQLDREEEDFALEVASAGATTPIVNPRQYKKNLGRTLKVKTESDTLEGELTQVDENGIRLKWSARESKPVGKGKITVVKEETIPYTDIVEAKVMIIF